MYTPSSLAPKWVTRVRVMGKTGPGKEETDANMRSQGGAESPLKHEGARSEGSGGDRGGYIHQRLVEQINKASQEGPSQVQAGTGLWRRCRQGSIVTAEDADMWGTGLLEPGTKRGGTTSRGETCKAGNRGGILRRAPKKVKGEELPTGGSPSPESPLLV